MSTLAKYWFVGSDVWCHYFTLVKYNTGDEVWVSKHTGKGYAGLTHDGYFWNSFDEIAENCLRGPWNE